MPPQRRLAKASSKGCRWPSRVCHQSPTRSPRETLRSPRTGGEGPGRGKILPRERPGVEGAILGSKERERQLAEQRVDRSHRRRSGIQDRRRPPPWTRGEKAGLVLSLAFIDAAVILAVVLFVIQT